YAFGASLMAALALGWARRPLGVTHVLWALVFGLLAMQSIRNISLFATIGMPLIGARLAVEVPALKRSVADWRRPGRMALMTAGGLLAAVLLWSSSQTAHGTPIQLGRDPVYADYPVGGVAYLRAHHLDGNMFNQYEWGGYLIDQLYPEYHVFMDGRPDVYGDALVEQYVAIDGAQPGWRQALDERNIRFVLVRRDGPLAAALAGDGGWREAFSGSVERLFVRADLLA
ncbi:MAG TPA: hypothetical protein VF937_17770, partial [Chloroflexota bacterium]